MIDWDMILWIGRYVTAFLLGVAGGVLVRHQRE